MYEYFHRILGYSKKDLFSEDLSTNHCPRQRYDKPYTASGGRNIYICFVWSLSICSLACDSRWHCNGRDFSFRVRDFFGCFKRVFQRYRAGRDRRCKSLVLVDAYDWGSLLPPLILTLVMLGLSIAVFRRASADLVDVL